MQNVVWIEYTTKISLIKIRNKCFIKFYYSQQHTMGNGNKNIRNNSGGGACLNKPLIPVKLVKCFLIYKQQYY